MFDSMSGTFFVDGLLPGEYVLRFMGLPAIKAITASGKDDFTTRPIDASNPNGLEDLVVTVTDKVAALSGIVQSDGGQLSPSVVLYFPDRPCAMVAIRPAPHADRVDERLEQRQDFQDRAAGRRVFILAVPSAQNRLWQDPKRLAAASALATRVRLAWDEKRTETLTMKEVK